MLTTDQDTCPHHKDSSTSDIEYEKMTKRVQLWRPSATDHVQSGERPTQESDSLEDCLFHFINVFYRPLSSTLNLSFISENAQIYIFPSGCQELKKFLDKRRHAFEVCGGKKYVLGSTESSNCFWNRLGSANWDVLCQIQNSFYF